MKKEKKISREIAEEIMADDLDFMEIARTSVFCHNCYSKTNKSVSMKIEEYLLNNLCDIILDGKCEVCGGRVARYIESGENPKSQKIAKGHLSTK